MHRFYFSKTCYLTLALLALAGVIAGSGCSRQVDESSLAQHQATPQLDWPTLTSAADLKSRIESSEAWARWRETADPVGLREQAKAKAEKVAKALNDFETWFAKGASTTDEAARDAWRAEGVAVAKARRDAMRWLIENDPELAINWTADAARRAALPLEISRELEQVVAGRGTYIVDVACGLPREGEEAASASWISRKLIHEGREFDVFVYGRRLAVTTKNSLPFHGVAVDNVMALGESGVVVANSPGALASVLRQRAGLPLAQEGISYFLGDELRQAQSLDEVAEAIAWQEADEAVLGPDGEAADSPWTEGAKTLLYIRVIFAGAPAGSEPLSLSQAQTHMNNVAIFMRDNSFERMTLSTTFTPTLSLPRTASEYGSLGWTTLLADARAAALAAGYVHSNYNFYTVASAAVPGYSWAGRAFVGGSASHLNGEFTLRVTAHELGHNLGLYHANYNYTPSENPMSREAYAHAPNNSPTQGYGNRYDMMGVNGTTTAVHFSAREKVLLDWLPRPDMPIILESGVHRVFRNDHRLATGVRGLRVPAGDTQRAFFWLGHRRNFTTNPYLSAGLEVVWGTSSNTSSGHLLIDTTPFSNDGPHNNTNAADNNDKVDAALTVGRMFGSPDAGAWFTVLGQGGASPDEYLDVAIEVGNFSRNRPPVVSLTPATANVALNAPLVLTATASDPDGDPVTLSWDFDDGAFAGDEAQVTKSWSATGWRVVRVVAVDRRGGVASARAVVRVGSPSTHTVSGRVTADGQGVEGVRVFNGLTGTAYRGTRTDSEGWFTLPNVASGTYTLDARKDGYVFAPANFTNPVAVSGATTNINFEATVAPPWSVVVDNSDSEGVVIHAGAGSWVSLTTVGGFYAHDYLTDNNTFKGQKWAEYRPTLETTGVYRVFMRYTESTNRATNVPVTITHSDGQGGATSSVVTVNQRVNGGTWYPLGEYIMTAGDTGGVRVDTGGTDGHVAIDAFRFELADGAPPTVRLLTTQGVARERGPVPGRMRVERDGDKSEELTVHLGPVDIDPEQVEEGVATPGVDYVMPPTRVTLAESESGVELEVMPVPDQEPEGDELAVFALRQPPPPSDRWEFNEPSGTELTAVGNLGEGGLVWTADIAGSTTTGDGAFRVRRGFNVNGISHAVLGSASVAEPLHLRMTTGGWVFAGTDATETVRLGFTTGVNNTVVAQILVARTVDGVVLSGEAVGTGATGIAPVVLSEALTSVEPYDFVLTVYPETLTYRIRYREGTAPYVTLGTGLMAADRSIGAVRFNIGGSLASTTGERFDVARIELGAGDPTQPVYFIAEPSVAVITIKDDPQDGWRWRMFSAEDRLDPAVAGWLADPVGDGVVNLKNYALGRDPWVRADGPLVATGEVEMDGERYLALTFVRRKDDDRLVVAVEAGEELTSGPWPGVAILHGTPQPVEGEEGLEQVTYRDVVPIGHAPRRFLRVRTTLTE